MFARGCVLIDASDPETPLYAKNPDAPIIPASTTKIMTCILAIEMAGDLSAAVAVPDEAARLGGSNSRMGLVRGESLPMRDLLYGLMLVSANDAALAIACHLAGSAEDFAALMNGKAAALGCAQVRLDACAENACPSDAGQGRLALVADLWGRTAFMRRTDIEAVRSAAPPPTPGGTRRRRRTHPRRRPAHRRILRPPPARRAASCFCCAAAGEGDELLRRRRAARFFADFLSGRSEFFVLATAGCAKLLVSGAAHPV